MMDNLDHRSSRLMLQMSTPSMRIRPAGGSSRWNRAIPREDFPVGQETVGHLPLASTLGPARWHRVHTPLPAQPILCHPEPWGRAERAGVLPQAVPKPSSFFHRRPGHPRSRELNPAS